MDLEYSFKAVITNITTKFPIRPKAQHKSEKTARIMVELLTFETEIAEKRRKYNISCKTLLIIIIIIFICQMHKHKFYNTHTR